MSLTLDRYTVSRLCAGQQTSLQSRCLSVDTHTLSKSLRNAEPRIASCRVSLASPGQQTRIVCVKDVVQPRAKRPPAKPGSGTSVVLDGVAVVTCGPILGFQEGIIDLSGPGADLSSFSRLHLVVLEIDVHQPLEAHAHEQVLREAGCRAAHLLANACMSGTPDTHEHFDLNDANACHAAAMTGIDTGAAVLPRIGYLDLVLAQGLLHDTYVLGDYAGNVLPMAIDPLLAIDDSVVSGNCVSACDKNTTYHHQNNPIVLELLRGHGTHWHFTAMVLSNLPTRLEQKQACTATACTLLTERGVDGVIISKEGFGNPDTDLMMVIERLESASVPCVAITDEFAGPDGASQSIADTTVKAVSVVSTGNANQRVVLPAMQTTFGSLPDLSRLSGGYPYSLRADGSLEVEVQAIIGATNEMGFETLSCKEE